MWGLVEDRYEGLRGQVKSKAKKNGIVRGNAKEGGRTGKSQGEADRRRQHTASSWYSSFISALDRPCDRSASSI